MTHGQKMEICNTRVNNFAQFSLRRCYINVESVDKCSIISPLLNGTFDFLIAFSYENRDAKCHRDARTLFFAFFCDGFSNT